MANQKYVDLQKINTHGVGVVNSSFAKEIVNGAIISADADNYTLVEFDGFDSEGNRKCKPLSASTVKGLLVSTFEEESLFGEESYQGNYNDFFNAQGEMVKLTVQEPYLRFEVSAYTGTPAVGSYAYYDAATKKYVCVAVPDTAMKAAKNQYLIVAKNTDFGANLGIPTIRVEVLPELITV